MSSLYVALCNRIVFSYVRPVSFFCFCCWLWRRRGCNFGWSLIRLRHTSNASHNDNSANTNNNNNDDDEDDNDSDGGGGSDDDDDDEDGDDDTTALNCGLLVWIAKSFELVWVPFLFSFNNSFHACSVLFCFLYVLWFYSFLNYVPSVLFTFITFSFVTNNELISIILHRVLLVCTCVCVCVCVPVYVCVNVFLFVVIVVVVFFLYQFMIN